jgi:hypothetical protein
MYGNNEDVPTKLMEIFRLSSPGNVHHIVQQVGATDPVSPQSY